MPGSKRPAPGLFDRQAQEEQQRYAPLADRMRPTSLENFVGQEKIIAPGTILRQAIDQDELFSLIFWGPPGSGKTTLARIIAQVTKSYWIQLSGVLSNKQDLLEAIEEARNRRQLHRQRTVLFVDEIHRWNKAQQDALLPHVEDGTVTLIGATTENPSFEIISPLLSRCRVFVLERLSADHMRVIVHQALGDTERGMGRESVDLDPQALDLVAQASNGDARAALNAMEVAIKAAGRTAKGQKHITVELITQAFQRPLLRYDKGGEEHYTVISAYIKSMRGSQPDAALYWLGRMIEAGEDPLFIARRMVVFASEDIGIADPQALTLAVACFQACDMVGLPECAINLAHVTVYLATAKKSNHTYVGYGKALEDVQSTLNAPVPMNLRNAPTQLMKDLGYHQGYKYSHNYEAEDGDQQYLPDGLEGHTYYQAPKP